MKRGRGAGYASAAGDGALAGVSTPFRLPAAVQLAPPLLVRKGGQTARL